jgi:hypothetical protein
MLMIAGGILLAIFGIFVIGALVQLVFTAIERVRNRNLPYSPPTMLGSQPSAEDLRRKYGVDPNHL